MTAESLARVLRHYRDSDWRADLAYVTGDLVQDDSDGYRQFVDLMRTVALPVHCVPGNHDIRQAMRACCAAASFPYCAQEHLANWLLIGLDSCIEHAAGGRVSAAELARLQTAIDETAAEHVAVFLHHPPVRMNSAWLDGVGLANANELLAELTRSKRVRLVVFGHVHQLWDSLHDGVRIIGTPSTCRQFRPGSRLFHVDDRPPAYSRLTLHTDGLVSTDLIWVEQ